jgi:hypothetical protein
MASPEAKPLVSRTVARTKAEDKIAKRKGPKEYDSVINDKGERICYTCGSTEH